jgi:hypothetical protein
MNSLKVYFIAAASFLCGTGLFGWDFSITRGGISHDEGVDDQESGFYSSFDGTDFMMTFIWHNDDSLNGLAFVSDGSDVDILWNSENGVENLHIFPHLIPHEYGVNLKYPIPMSGNAGFGLITVNIKRSEDYRIFYYAAGFSYDYFDFLNTGIEIAGWIEEGRPDFSVQPVFYFTGSDVFSLRFGLDVVSMFSGDIRKMIYFDFRLGWEW